MLFIILLYVQKCLLLLATMVPVSTIEFDSDFLASLLSKNICEAMVGGRHVAAMVPVATIEFDSTFLAGILSILFARRSDSQDACGCNGASIND